ncbi:cell division protein FtsL [Dokdonella sp.]|uniref:cell division protein FtsL n=1 Tax=Dokdonella sp. TaxID=2291710 RepID=UPI0031C2917C|nr:cell division protein FtsL [Dokdonella sp.]
MTRALALALLLAVIASALAVVYMRQQSRLEFGELTRVGIERDELNIEFGRLQLEQATWAENNRIEQIARGAFGLVTPTPADSVVIRR